MEKKIDRRRPESLTDYLALAVTTFGVGYLPLAPGTFGSLVGVMIYLAVAWGEAVVAISLLQDGWRDVQISAWLHAANLVLFLSFSLLGIRAAGRATLLFGSDDPPEAVIDEVIGQLVVFLFVPFGITWHFVLAGFVLFRLFDIWKPYPIDYLQSLPAGIGVCGDDILAGVYAGVCLAIIHAINLSL